MRDIALYYPYIHVRDDSWLKAAALFWPKMARLTPSDYPRHDSDVARALHDELGFFLDITPPPEEVLQVSREFFEFISENERVVRRRYGPHRTKKVPVEWRDAWREMQEAEVLADNLWRGSVHVEKLTWGLRRRLERYGLGTLTSDGDRWFVLHPALSATYTTALIDRVAQANDLAMVTDQFELHKLHRCAEADDFGALLLGRDRHRPRRTADDVAALYASVSITAVVPAGLDDVPVSKIIKVRRRLADEFDVYHQHLRSLADDFAELGEISSQEVLGARLNLMVERDLRRPTAELERNLRQLGLEPATATLGMKTLELPAAAAAITAAAGIPAAASQAGMITARLIGAGARARADRRTARLGGPAGYLLGLGKQLRPSLGRRLLDRFTRRS